MQKRILVVEDQATLCRQMVDALNQSGYQAIGASNGTEALAAVESNPPALVLLETKLPVMDGWSLLRILRGSARHRELPVILLSDSASRDSVLRAAKLGVRGYLVKGGFPWVDLSNRVSRCLQLQTGPGADAASSPNVAGAAAANSANGNVASLSPAQRSPLRMSGAGVDDLPVLLTREHCIRRAERALAGSTLSGAVAQVLALSVSPNADMSQLASLIGRDSMLSARVLQAANSPAYASKRGVVTTLADAVRNIGCAAIRNIAASVGIFDAMPATCADGFNPIRCWQHSFAVARLSEMLMTLTDPAQAGIAYLAGLCHDLGEILFHTQFGPEHKQIVEAEESIGLPREEIERHMLGVTRGQLIRTIMQCIGLPETIRRPVEALHAARRGLPNDQIAKVLSLAETYANGMLLFSSSQALLSPLLRSTCQAVAGSPDPVPPDADAFRSEILCLTAMLARLGAKEEAKLLKPPFARSSARVWVARESCFSSFGPVTAALSSLATVEVHDRLPAAGEAADCGKLIAISRGTSLAGFTQPEIQKSLAAHCGTLGSALWLTEQCEPRQETGVIGRRAYPLPVGDLARVLEVPAISAAA